MKEIGIGKKLFYLPQNIAAEAGAAAAALPLPSPSTGMEMKISESGNDVERMKEREM